MRGFITGFVATLLVGVISIMLADIFVEKAWLFGWIGGVIAACTLNILNAYGTIR